MTQEEQLFTLACAATMGLIARGASPSEVRDTAWQYAQFALNGKPQDEEV